MSSILETADARQRRELLDKINAEAQRAWGSDPKFRADFAADLTESVLTGFTQNPIIANLLNTQTVGFGDRLLLRDTKGLEARWLARGGYIEASSLTTSVTEMPRDTIGIHVSEMTDKFATGFSETAQTMRSLAQRRLESAVLLRIWALLVAGTAVTPAGGAEQAAVDAAIDQVSEATETGTVRVAGPPSAISYLLKFTGFGQNTLDEITRSGSLGQYRGAEIVKLTGVKDSAGNTVLDSKTVVVVAPDAGRVVNYGGLLSKEFEENDNWYWHYLARRDVGMIVNYPTRLVEIKFA